MTNQPSRYIAPLRVQCAFGDESASVEAMIVVSHDKGRATLRTVKGKDRAATIVDADGFAAALDRADLTLIRGEHPFVLANVRRQLLALAYGPPLVPESVRVFANIVLLGEHGAVEIPGEDDTQPSWLLFEADIS